MARHLNPVFRAAVIALALAAYPLDVPAQQPPPRGRTAGAQTPRRVDKKKEAKKRPPLTMVVGWTAALPALATGSPVAAGDRVFVPLESGEVLAVSVMTGAVEWTSRVQGAGPLTVGSGLVFVSDATGIAALDASSGTLRWSVTLPGKLTAPLVTQSGWLLAGTDQADAIMFRAATGEVLWKQALGSPLRERPALSADHIYLLLEDRRVVALKLESGAQIWERRLRGRGTSLLALDDRVFVGADDRFFYCLASKDGKVKWRWRTGAPIVGTAVVDEHNVYFVSLDNVLRALHWGDGEQQWKASLPLRPSCGPFLTGRVLLVPGQAAEVPAFQWVDGSTAGSAKLPGEPKWPPVLLAAPDPDLGRLLAATGEGQLVLLVPGLQPLPSKSYPGLPIAPPGLPEDDGRGSG